MTFSGLAEGTYQVRVVARVEGDGVETERGIASSVVTVTRGAACAAHLINRGVSVSGRRAVVEFSSSGEAAVSEFRCSLDGAPQETCELDKDYVQDPDVSTDVHRCQSNGS